jgi:hypothetical protein
LTPESIWVKSASQDGVYLAKFQYKILVFRIQGKKNVIF